MNMNMDIRGVIVESKGEDGENSIELELDIEGLSETESSDTTYDSYTDSYYSNYSDTLILMISLNTLHNYNYMNQLTSTLIWLNY